MLYDSAVMVLQSIGTPSLRTDFFGKESFLRRVNWLLVCYCIAYSVMLTVYPVEHIDTSILIYPSIHGQNEISSELHLTSWFLSRGVFYLQQCCPTLSVFSIILLVVNFFSGCILCSTLLEGKSDTGRIVGILLLIYLFWSDISSVLYGVTSFLGAISAYIYCRSHASKRHICSLVFGILFFGLAIQIRASAIIGIVPFIFLIAVFDYAGRRFREAGVAVLCMLLVGISFISSRQLSECPIWSVDAPYQDSNEISLIRGKFCDYADCSGKDKSKQYSEIGVSDNDLELITRSCIIHPRRGDSGWWEDLAEVRANGNQSFPMSFKLIKERLYSYDQWGYVGFAYTVCIVLGIFAFLYRKQYIVLMILGIYIACSLLLIMRGRFTCAAPPAMMVCTSVLTFYFIQIPPLAFPRWLRVCIYVFLGAFSVFLLIYNQFYRLRPLFTPISNIERVCRLNQKNIYLTFNSLLWWKKGSRRVSPFAEDYKRTPNLFTLSSWLVPMPSYNFEMEKYMKTYPIMDFTAPNVYFIAYGPWELEPVCTYLKEHAGKNAHIVTAGSADGFGIYRLKEE